MHALETDDFHLKNEKGYLIDFSGRPNLCFGIVQILEGH